MRLVDALDERVSAAGAKQAVDFQPWPGARLHREVKRVDAFADVAVLRTKSDFSLRGAQRRREAGADFQMIGDAGDEFQDCAVRGEERAGLGRNRRWF